jgi:hypothetical protein
MVTKTCNHPLRVQFEFTNAVCTRWFEANGGLRIVGPEYLYSFIESYRKLLCKLLKDEWVLQLVKKIEAEGVHDKVMIRHAYIEVLTEQCEKLANAGLINEWPRVTEQDVRNTLALGTMKLEQHQKAVANKEAPSKEPKPQLTGEQRRALELVYESPDGLTGEKLLAHGITQETMESLERLGLVE